MLVLIDDIKLDNEADFLAYIDEALPGDRISSLTDLADYLLSTDEEIELIVSDLDEAKDKSLVSSVMKIFTDASDAKQTIRLTKM